MDKVYQDSPQNFSEIVPYIITDIDNIKKEIILAKRCYFYDTCSFRNHMLSPETGLIFEYITSTLGIVIITRTVIMELCSNDGSLWNEHIQYIKNLHSAGIEILVIYEEDLFEVLHTCYSDITEINMWLSYALRNAKGKAGSIEKVINQDVKLKKALFENEACKDSKLAEKIFKAVRISKESGDNMGEEMIAICVHWLSHIKEASPYKYIIFSDDKKAMSTFSKVINNSRKFLELDMISVFTTAKLCYQMKLNGIVQQEEQIINLLSKNNNDNIIKVFCSEEFELSPTEKTMSATLFAKKTITQNIKVYY